MDHITSIPAQPEPYYTPTGLEMQPKPSGEDYGMIVYQYSPISAVNYVSILTSFGKSIIKVDTHLNKFKDFEKNKYRSFILSV